MHTSHVWGQGLILFPLKLATKSSLTSAGAGLRPSFLIITNIGATNYRHINVQIGNIAAAIFQASQFTNTLV